MKTKTLRCGNGRIAKTDSTPKTSTLRDCCTFFLTALMLTLFSCQSPQDEDPMPEQPTVSDVFILNEGNFMASNATLTKYTPLTKSTVSDIFAPANSGAPLGDSPSSFTQFNSNYLISLSNSGKIYAIDAQGRLVGKITGLNSPRHIYIVSPTKAYVSNLWSNQIDIINPTTYEITGKIELPEGYFAERFVKCGDYLYTNCWSYGTKILRIDPAQNKITESLEVGIQPITLLKDAKGNLWTLTDGGYQGNPIGFEEPAILCIDPVQFRILKKIALPRGSAIMYSMAMAADGLSIYYVDKNLYKMSIESATLPPTHFVSGFGQNFYSIGVEPSSGDIYLGDAIDFMQNGKVSRYDKDGALIDTFKAGIIPGAFGFGYN